MKTLIQLDKIFKTYDVDVLKNINLKINSGEFIGLIGANGGGKSTLCEIIANIRKPTKGLVIKNEKTIVGIQFQDLRYPPGISVIDMIMYYLRSFNIEMNSKQLNDLLLTYQIDDFKNRFVANLSGGQQQRLNILLAMIHKPDVIVLDEISTGLDVQVREEIFKFIQKNIVNKNVAILLVTHMMDEVERFCDRLIFLDKGKIVDDQKVKNVIHKFDSIYQYAQIMLKKYRKTIELKVSKDSKKKQKFFNHQKRNSHKIGGLLHLMIKYYYRNAFVPFFLIIYPILALFLIGFGIKNLEYNNLEHLSSLVSGIGVVQIISIGIFILPETILDFKKSILMKRIGATNIKPLAFNFTIVSIGVVFMTFAWLWTLLWAGIIFGQEYGWDQILRATQIVKSLPFLFILLISAVNFGLMLTAFFKTSTAYIAASNLIFIFIAFLSGGFVPFSILIQSDITNIFMYFNPFYYITDLYMSVLSNEFVFGYRFAIFLPISIGFLIFYIFVGVKNLKWQQ